MKYSQGVHLVPSMGQGDYQTVSIPARQVTLAEFAWLLLTTKSHNIPLCDKLLDECLCAEIKAEGRPRYQIQQDIKRKEKAREMLCKR